MQVYVVINTDELDAESIIQGIFVNKKDAEQFWMAFKSDRFHYEIKEYEAVE